MGTASETELSGFNRLLDSVLENPESVPDIVKQCPEIIECVNNSAETVLHWLAVENRVAEIVLLHKLGAMVPAFALVHALQAGHVETVDLLLKLGGNFGPVDPFHELRNPIWQLTARKQDELIECLNNHGYKA